MEDRRAIVGIAHVSQYRFDLIRPCDHCPFRKDEGRIEFSNRSRAEEIEESAYRNGFVCHEHAEWLEEDESPWGEGGAYARADGSSQHCFGALFMYLRNGSGNVPWEWAMEEDEDLETRWWDRLTPEQLNHALAVVWENEEEFFEAHDDAD